MSPHRADNDHIRIMVEFRETRQLETRELRKSAPAYSLWPAGISPRVASQDARDERQAARIELES